MNDSGRQRHVRSDRPLAEREAWLVTDGKAGHEAQAEGVGQALGARCRFVRVAPTGIAKLLAPWGPCDSAFRPEPPWPAIAIGIGRTAIPALRALRRRAGAGTFTVALQDPRTGARTADLVWVPEHDRLRGANVITTLTPPNRFTDAVLSAARAAGDPADAVASLPRPRVMLAIGGASKVWRFTTDDAARLAAAIAHFGLQGAAFLMTPSRRTPPEVASALAAAIAPFPHVAWSGDGENPYVRFLALADAIVVTADSVSMTGEAVSTGRPVYVFHPSGGSDKFRRFHDALSQARVTRPLHEQTTLDTGWSYPPIRSADTIAQEIERRFVSRARFIGSMMGGGA
ncbi:MAG: mitochondrial fission ELM1 family protein [Hyphomicrobiaceae bacterium]